uniref:TFIID subunit TAF5 NTD2 domain-containing protein n=1 Tax=Aegilops tauschii subsp. strangulata TaxID=200361 RepID=A0A453T4Z6_AEGTS
MGIQFSGPIQARAFFLKFREDHELMHSRDLQKLEGTLSPLHLEEMDLARSLRENKFRIKLCEYSYELLLQYLQKTQALVMLGIINERIIFEGTVPSLLRLYRTFYLPSLLTFPPLPSIYIGSVRWAAFIDL